MSFRSCTSSFRKSLALGTALCGLAWGALELAPLPRTAFFGGRKLAEKFERLAPFERAGAVDVFVVGPSFVDQGFDGAAFGATTGKRAFNLGVAGTDLYLQSLLVRDVLLPGRRPEALIWSLREETLTRSNINRQYLQAPALRYADKPFGRWAFGLGQYLPQFQRRRALDWYQELCLPPDEPLDEWGRTQLAALTRQERRESQADEGDEEGGRRAFLAEDYAVELEPARAHVRETLRRAREQGSAVWLLFTPYHRTVFLRRSAYAEELLTGVNAEYIGWVEALAAELDLTLVDLRYCAEISDKDEYFFDARHLNGPGAAALGELLGKLYSGERPLPAAWKGVSGRAAREAILGRVERDQVPVLALEERHALGQALCVRHEGRLSDTYAAFRVERAGAYEVRLVDDGPRARSGTYFVRLGEGNYQVLHAPAEAPRVARVLTAELAVGEHVFEMHTRSGEAIDWAAFEVRPAGE